MQWFPSLATKLDHLKSFLNADSLASLQILWALEDKITHGASGGGKMQIIGFIKISFCFYWDSEGQKTNL